MFVTWPSFNKFYSKWLLKRSPVRVGATISEISTSIQTPKDMVFSQTSLKTQTVLKVVEIDRLKATKNQQVNGSTGVITDGYAGASPPSPVATTSYSEDFLKPEPLFESLMCHESDSEFFQDLVQWCSTPAKEEQVQTIDSPKIIEDRALNMDNTYTSFSPQGWDAFDANSPYAHTGFYNNNTRMDPLSPTIDGFGPFENSLLTTQDEEPSNIQYQEQFLDLGSLPIVIGGLTSEKVAEASQWLTSEPTQHWASTHDTDYTYNKTQNEVPFIYQEDSLDSKCISVTPREVETNNVVISEYVISTDRGREGLLQETGMAGRGGLSVDVARAPLWPSHSISTPEVLNYVEQLEKEKCSHSVSKPAGQWPAQEVLSDLLTTNLKTDRPSPPVEYEPITPKSESHAESDLEDAKVHTSKKRHHDSEDSDATYTPYIEQSRKYKRRKPNVPIKDMILALEGSQTLTKARRGRPPKRRESTVSSVCSVDDNTSSVSTQEMKYRELRDKNNEASKRSRMNRKLKELQMEQKVVELEERNKKLKIQVDVLEEMSKKMKDALMSVILQK
ncbi:hypothetical protein K1T71_006571 [Dendrolimus kikuchii]|uniref:Uncharacterized protein n=1 Tax=Dendrolimus kikuchii TaxID=765133 RepID=A0ACC1D189_9NEOP|nr:hypothetical protein K1T71_006571 [Dendrolimus kikuchii]